MADRISLLEATVREMQREKPVVPSTPEPSRSPNISERLRAGALNDENLNPLGKLVFVKDRSRYLHPSFWAGMYDEITDLKFLLREEVQTPAASFIFGRIGVQQQQYIHPQLPASDFLLQSFFDNVDPFVRIIHKPMLLMGVNHFRRGVLNSVAEFEYFIFAIYALALLSLKDDAVLVHLGEDRRTLLGRYKSIIEDGLSRFKVTTTHSLSVLRLFVLYITILFWTGEMLQASSLLGLAVRIAQRMGYHKDPSDFNISPWDQEIRRRVWHHIRLLDTWSAESHGLEMVVADERVDVALPQSSNDAAWDLSEFASSPPHQATKSFTDMTHFLVSCEIAATTRSVLHNPGPTHHIQSYLEKHSEKIKIAREHIERTYLSQLDITKPVQRLARDLAELSLHSIALMQLQTIMTARYIEESAKRALEPRIYQMAIEYCKTSQNLIDLYTPHNLDWIVIRYFSWHSVAIMLSTVLRHQALERTPEARAARERIDNILQHRSSIDHLTGNDNLWQPLQRLRQELEAITTSDAQVDAVSMWDTNVDLEAFGIDEAQFRLFGGSWAAR